MGLLSDPYQLGQTIGFTVGIGFGAYFLARKALPERRTGAVAQLMKKTGVEDEGEEKRSRWVPPPSLIAVVAGLVAGLVSLRLFAKPGFNAADLSELRRGYDEGCNKRCLSDGGEEPLCKRFCTCTLGEIAKRNPTDEDLVEWFNGAKRQNPMSMKELGDAQEACLSQLRPTIPKIR